MLLVLAQIASAVECRVNGLNWQEAEYKSILRTVNVSVDTSINKVVLDGYTMECRHGVDPGVMPLLTVAPESNIGVVLIPPYNSLRGGLRFGGSNYPIPVRNNIALGVQSGSDPFLSVLGRVYLDVGVSPGDYVNIKSGDHVATINLRMKFSNIFGQKDFRTAVDLIARNSLNMGPTACTVNNNNPIDVNFGSVDSAVVGGDIPAGTPYRQSVVLNYSCPYPSIFSYIDIKLVGAASSFNSSALATSNPNLATAMIRDSSLVAPGGSFRTLISHSSGSDTVLFTLFRKTGSLPAAGPFTGSATLVMSVP